MTRGEAMRKARKSRGMRIKDLAEVTEIAYETIRRAEVGVGNPSIEIVELCADALFMTIDEYVGHEVRRMNERDEYEEYYRTYRRVSRL